MKVTDCPQTMMRMGPDGVINHDADAEPPNRPGSAVSYCSELSLQKVSVQKKSGVELLSHTLMCSIIVAGPLNNRVRDGNVCCKTAVNTGKNRKRG